LKMRQTTSFLLLLFLLGGSIVTAQTQIPINEPIEKFRRYVGTGISTPTGLLEDGGRRGFHFWGRVGYALTPSIEISFGPDYHTFDRDNSGQFGTNGGRLYTLMLGADIKRNLGTDPEISNPYVFAGVGWAYMKVLPLTTLARGTQRFESAEGLFLEGGLGVELDWVFLQAKVVRVAKRYVGDGLTHFPFSVGLRF
jgi:hypothetical protein